MTGVADGGGACPTTSGEVSGAVSLVLACTRDPETWGEVDASRTRKVGAGAGAVGGAGGHGGVVDTQGMNAGA